MTTASSPPNDRRVVISQAELLHVTGVQLAQYRDACWFANMWAEHCRPGMHLRAVHYKLVSVGVMMAPGVRPHTGRGRPTSDPVLDAICLPYENTPFCWSWLQKCAITARYYRLVDAREFEEHRSPEAIIHAETRDTPVPAISLPETWPADDHFPQPIIYGYDYAEADQPCIIEVWSEKSTMDDVLVPACRGLWVNYQPLSGMFSITRAVEMLCRVRKPAVVLYISDLDAAGCNMPTAFADALAHYGPIYAPGIDIKLKQIALTEHQVLDYDLPRNTIDESAYNKRFLAAHPLGPCELDALEAIHPGELQRLVRREILRYRDGILPFRLFEAHRDAQDRVDTQWHVQSADLRAQLDRLQADIDAVRARRDEELRPLEEQIAAIRARYAVELQPLEITQEELRLNVLDMVIEVDLPLRPEPEVRLPDADWLFAGVGDDPPELDRS